VSVNTEGLTPDSTYHATIVIENDSREPTVEIPVTLHTWQVGVEETPSLPTVFALHQNYPNPAIGNTTIKYAIPKKTNISLKIYDISGRVVKTLASGVKEPAYYTVKWNGVDDRDRRVPAGVYFVRFDSKEFTQTRKLILAR
jgi:hypothetical protein